MKRLAALFCVFVVWAFTPIDAGALPPDCEKICKCSTPCSAACAIGGTMRVTTCGAMELACIGFCPANAAELQPDEGLTCTQAPE